MEEIGPEKWGLIERFFLWIQRKSQISRTIESHVKNRLYWTNSTRSNECCQELLAIRDRKHAKPRLQNLETSGVTHILATHLQILKILRMAFFHPHHLPQIFR